MNYIVDRLHISALFKPAFFFLAILCFQQVLAQNPFMPATAFIPDGEPRVFEHKGEKRVYVYGSRDELQTNFCGYGHDVWSAPVDNLSQWVNHGEVFHVNQIKATGFSIKDHQRLYAPDCVYNPVTKKYYLYVFTGKNYKMDGIEGPQPGSENYIPGFENDGPRCFVASSESPIGPFYNPIPCDWPAGNQSGTFDPGVLVDEQNDGSIRVYAYWGFRETDRWAEIDPTDMHTIINPQTKKPDRNAWHKTFPKKSESFNSSLFEASSIRKIAPDKYAFIYSAKERNSALSYCYSTSPEGPWIYGGRIVDTKNNWIGRNNHGSIFNANKNWYVVYHRHTTIKYHRQAMIEPISLSYEGDQLIIPQVEMTSQGIETNGLDAFKRYNAAISCYRTNNAHIEGKQRNPDGLNPVVGLDGNNTIIGYKYLNFGEKSIRDKDNLALKLNIKKRSDVEISVQIAQPTVVDEEIQPIEITSFKLQDYIKTKDNLYHEISVPIKTLNNNKLLNKIGGLKGKLGLYLAFNGKGKDLCRIKEFEFALGDTPTPNPLHEIDFLTKASEKGKLYSVPSKARIGESVKISVAPNLGFQLDSIIVKDESGNIIDIQQNIKAPMALESYNFFMPNAKVIIESKYYKD